MQSLILNYVVIFSRSIRKVPPFTEELESLFGDQYGIRIRECYRERVVC